LRTSKARVCSRARRTDVGATIAREIGLESEMLEADLALFGWCIQT
jgi:hypothetical protein